MKKSIIMPPIVLCSICVVVAFILGVVNLITKPFIEANQSNASNAALIEVLPGGKEFKEITITEDYPECIDSGWTAEGGFVFRATVKGKSDGLVIMCGIDSDGKLVATKVISNNETPSYAENVFPYVEGDKGEYSGMDIDSFDPYLVSGATLTSKAYAEAVKAALQSAIIAGGGSVDIRTPEQILQDNCNLALGTEGKTFERWFATEALTGVKNVYVCDSGVVMLIGDAYIGIAEGALVKSVAQDGTVSDVGEEEGAVAIAAYTLYSATSLTEIERPKGASKRVKKIELTATGNYIFHMEAEGNGINGEEWSHPSGEYIKFMVCISPDGKIIDVKTTYQSESDGYGNVCETDEYTEQFKGAAAGDVVITPEGGSKDSTDLGVISGSTITSNGYQRALKQAFAAFELLISEGADE